jgi:hypothetical protein
MLAPELTTATTGHRVVRFTGMVQDMLDTEYFSSASSSSELESIRSSVSSISHHHHHQSQLRERSILVLVPPPTTTHFPPESLPQPQSKRPKLHPNNGNNDANNNNDDDNMQLCHPEHERSNHASSSSMGPILAKFYYEQYDPITSTSTSSSSATAPTKQQQQQQSLSRLKLNEMVEILAVVEDELDDEQENRMHPMEDEGLFPMDIGTLDSVVLPRPILHVLWYAKLVDVEQHHFHPKDVPQAPRPHFGTDSTTNNDGMVNVSQLATAFQLDETSMAAVWMVLHSKAERKKTSSDDNIQDDDAEAIVTPQNTLLGCASLNIRFRDTSTATETSTMVFLNALQSLVSKNIHYLSITPHTLEESLLAPSKIAGRLQPTPLQLPAGSLVILDIRGLGPGKLSTRQVQNLRNLQELCATHRLSYTFDGGIRIPFEADYRIIVLSDARTYKLLSCHLTVQNTFAAIAPHDNHASSATSATSITASRQRLASNRRQIGNIQLSSSVLERAQQDFLRRRPHVGETDFHRWLTLTRLHARSRQSNVADILDWEQALQLDDRMKTSLQQ